MKRLAAVDNTLEELGTPKIYQKLHVCVKRVLIGWLMCSQMANISNMMWWFYTMEDHWRIIIPCITNHLQHANMFMDLVFTTYLWYCLKYLYILHNVLINIYFRNKLIP